MDNFEKFSNRKGAKPRKQDDRRSRRAARELKRGSYAD